MPHLENTHQTILRGLHDLIGTTIRMYEERPPTKEGDFIFFLCVVSKFAMTTDDLAVFASLMGVDRARFDSWIQGRNTPDVAIRKKMVDRTIAWMKRRQYELGFEIAVL